MKIDPKTAVGYAVLLSLLLVPVFYPEIDLAVSSMFYRAQEGFFLAHLPVVRFVYNSVAFLAVAMALVMAVLLVRSFKNAPERGSFLRRALLYLLAVFVIGSGVIVNWGLKEHWGRARPVQVQAFGGEKRFTPPAVMTDQCRHNCSFSCGHCSFAWGFVAFYFLLRRRWVLALALGYGILVSLGRIVQGKHFLSDALYSAVIMVVTAHLLYVLIMKGRRFPNRT